MWALGILYGVLVFGKFSWPVARAGDSAFDSFVNARDVYLERLTVDMRPIVSAMLDLDPMRRSRIDDLLHLWKDVRYRS